MKQYLVRKCSHCKSICKIIRENGKIIHLEGLRQAQIYSSYKKDRTEYMRSEKMVMCIQKHKDPILLSQLWFACCTFMLVSKFKEIKV